MGSWFYMSFADATLPEGSQFLGGCYVEAPTQVAAVTKSHRLGINPGGSVQIVGPLSDETMDANTLKADRHRLLSREEIEPRPAEPDEPSGILVWYTDAAGDRQSVEIETSVPRYVTEIGCTTREAAIAFGRTLLAELTT